MKATACILFILLIFNPFVSAQEKIVVKPGTSVISYFKQDEIYKYPKFKSGKVSFQSGSTMVALLNYNILLSEMHFMQPPKDTLAISNPAYIKFISIEGDTFYFNDGYLLYTAQNSKIKLYQKQYIKVDDVRKSAGYGTTSSTSAITTLGNLGGGSSHFTHNLVSQEELVLSKRLDFYFSDSLNKFYPFIKKNILKVYSEDKQKIGEFVKTNKIDFEKGEDAMKLFDFFFFF